MKLFLRESAPLAPAFAALVAVLALAPASATAQLAYRQKNLVSDIPGLAAHTDPNLINPWGISSSASSPFWVSDADAGVSTLYDTAGHPLPLVVSIPKPGGGAAAPTGQVFNSSADFNGNRFLFATEDGTIAGWRGALGSTAETLVDHTSDGASYKGLALGATGGGNYLYAANFTQARIDVVPATGAPALSGAFTDPSLPSGYAPFNIRNLGGSLYVTYAKIGAGGDEEEAGAGLGFVDKLDLDGNLVMRVASNGVLNAPWGVALAPATFGPLAGDLLVGNFGDGLIHAFDPVTGDLLGALKDEHGNPLVIEGLWGLQFGNGGAGGKPNSLYFAAGIDDEAHGLFGRLTPVPEPATYGALATAGLLAAIALRRRKAAALTWARLLRICR